MEYFVSPQGRDSWNGTQSQPFATLERARDAVRAMQREGNFPAEGVVINLRRGDYQLTQSFVLTKDDSGRPGAPVVYRAYEDEPVRLLGGKRLTGFAPVTDPAIKERLDPAAREHVVQVDLRTQGIADLGRFTSRGFNRPVSPAHLEVFVDGARLTPARWPNDDYDIIAGVPVETAFNSEWGTTTGALEHGFHYTGDRPQRWRQTDNIWVHGYWLYDWANSYEHVAAIDVAQRLVTTQPPHGQYGFAAGQRFYFLNILEELDQPGEYYLDADTGILYCWLPESADNAEVMASMLEQPLLQMHGTSDVVFRGLTFACTRGTAVQVSGGARVLIGGCTFRAIGNLGVVVDGGTEHGVAGCDLSAIGDAGIKLTGGDRDTLTPCGHYAENNHIHHFAEWSRTYQAGVELAGVGIRVAHNCIHDGPHTGILLNGNDHRIEYNELYRMCMETGDVGAFYMGRDYTQQGIIIRHNFFHHLGGMGLGSMAIYLDDCSSGVAITGNVFYRTQYAAFIGGGRDNLVENNIFVDCNPAVHVDGRGADAHSVWRNMVHVTMKERLEAMNYRLPPYSVRYPKLRELEQYFIGTPGIPPEGNCVRRNIQVGGRWLDIQQPATLDMLKVGDNLLDTDPLFVDPAAMNFTLREDSPAYALGFQPILVDEIGLYVDEYRKALPERN